jgi:hypothetical protein
MSYTTQQGLLLNKLMEFYKKNDNLDKILPIINGEHKVSLRLIDWFVTNYSKKYFTQYSIYDKSGVDNKTNFKIYVDYKLKLKAYSKKRFDPFCRWERIMVPYNNSSSIQTTLGQLNFFKWILEHKILKYIEKNIVEIENDMNTRSSSSRNRSLLSTNQTRKKRKELSISATKNIKREDVEIIVKFD